MINIDLKSMTLADKFISRAIRDELKTLQKKYNNRDEEHEKYKNIDKEIVIFKKLLAGKVWPNK